MFFVFIGTRKTMLFVLSLVPAINQTKLNLSYLLKIDKKHYKVIDIYYIGYITKKIGDCENIYFVNPLYLIIGEVDGNI